MKQMALRCINFSWTSSIFWIRQTSFLQSLDCVQIIDMIPDVQESRISPFISVISPKIVLKQSSAMGSKLYQSPFFFCIFQNIRMDLYYLQSMQDNQQQNNEAIRQIKKQRFKLNILQKQRLQKIFLAHLEPNFQQLHYRVLLVHGIPTEYRNYIWTQLIPNYHRISQNIYLQLVQELKVYRTQQPQQIQSANQASTVAESNQQGLNPQNANEIQQKMQTFIRLIQQDIPRTFPELKIVDDKNQYEKLSNILGCFAIFRSDIGYIQGISLIGTLLLQQLNAEYRTFVALTTIITTSVLYDFYTFNTLTITKTSENIIEHLSSQKQVYQLFVKQSIDIKMVAIQWIMTMFSRCFQLDSILHLWDLLLAHQMKPYIIQKLCATIIRVRKTHILQQTQESTIVKILKNTKLTFHQEEEIFKIMRQVQFQQD